MEFLNITYTGSTLCNVVNNTFVQDSSCLTDQISHNHIRFVNDIPVILHSKQTGCKGMN